VYVCVCVSHCARSSTESILEGSPLSRPISLHVASLPRMHMQRLCDCERLVYAKQEGCHCLADGISEAKCCKQDEQTQARRAVMPGPSHLAMRAKPRRQSNYIYRI